MKKEKSCNGADDIIENDSLKMVYLINIKYSKAIRSQEVQIIARNKIQALIDFIQEIIQT